LLLMHLTAIIILIFGYSYYYVKFKLKTWVLYKD
jgi:hypothetical protein